MKMIEGPKEKFHGITRRTFVKGVGGLAGLTVFGVLGCSHKKKKPVVVVPKVKPIITIKYKDKNLNGKYDPWIDDRIGEDWFFREGDHMVIYIVPENAITGDVIDYSITGPNKKEFLKESRPFSSETGYVKIDGYGTNMTEYFVEQGGYGTFTIQAFHNGNPLMAGGKEFKISAKPRD
jgi:hypothetical protein